MSPETTMIYRLISTNKLLSDTIYAQQKEIEMLNAQLSEIREQLCKNPFTRDSFRPGVSMNHIWNGSLTVTQKEKSNE